MFKIKIKLSKKSPIISRVFIVIGSAKAAYNLELMASKQYFNVNLKGSVSFVAFQDLSDNACVGF